MGTTHNAGFTIIETMLFLAITGMLIAGILVGVGTSINVQRYRDSVSTFKAFLQGQYGDIKNVQNDRDDAWRCDPNANTTQTGISEGRGQSKCVIIGRYITVVGSTTTVVAVTAYEKPVAGTGDDINKLKDGYFLGLSTINQQKDEMEWGTAIAWPVSGSGAKNPTTPRSIAILIVRSPDSGSIYTFTGDTVPAIDTVNDTKLKDMLVTGVGPTPSQAQRTICIDSQGLIFTANMAVFIQAYAVDEASIETRSNETITSLGGDTKC